jgi:NTP pyrophosphatase (non-canonical NTP hydrolase)
MRRTDIHRIVIRHFGVTAQIYKAIEELGELKEALRNSDILLSKKASREDILSEMADVYNMLEQLEIIFRFSSDDVEDMQDYKMQRTKERIGRDIE